MDYHVRGGIGTQIMQFLAANALAWENNSNVDKIILNWGYYPNWMYDDSKRGNHLVDVNYLQEDKYYNISQNLIKLIQSM